MIIILTVSRDRASRYGTGAHRPLFKSEKIISIGPGSKFVGAHVTGDLEPAIPKPIKGRIPTNPETIAHELPLSAVGYSVAYQLRLWLYTSREWYL
jgi:hypothetical protein